MKEIASRRAPRRPQGVQGFELRLYRRLGVLRLRRLLFALERARRGSGGGRNQNYHLERLSPEGAERFEGYLLYHTVLHGTSALLLAPLIPLLHICGLSWGAASVLPGLLIALHIWCIMLQRFNQLRIRRLRQRSQLARRRRMESRLDRLLDAFSPDDSPACMEEDLRQVRGILDGLSKGEDVFLNEAEGLFRLAELLERADLLPPPSGRSPVRRREWTLEELAARARPYGRVEARADRIQRRLRPGAPGMLSRCAVVTENAQAEAAFRRLFGEGGPERVYETLTLLARALERRLAEKR